MAQYISKEWCYTINHNDEAEGDPETQLGAIYDALLGIDCVYNVYKGEIGKRDKRHHIQGFIIFDKKMTLKMVRALFESELGCHWAHLEKMKGTVWQAADYCKKSDTAWDALPLIEIGNLGLKPCDVGRHWDPMHRDRCATCKQKHDDELDSLGREIASPDFQDWLTKMTKRH